jgi:hypothetical protein
MFDEFIRTSAMTIVSFIYLILVFILYNLKGKNEKITNRIFAWIIYFTFFLGVLFLIWTGLAVSNNELKFIVGRIATFGFTCWDILLLFYISFVFRDNEKNIEFFKKYKLKLIIIGVLIAIVCLVLSFILPIEIYRTRIRFTHHIGGAVATFEQCVRNLVILFSFVSILKNNKKIDALTKVLFGVLMCVCAIQLIHVLVGPFKLNDDILINVFAIFLMLLPIP